MVVSESRIIGSELDGFLMVSQRLFGVAKVRERQSELVVDRGIFGEDAQALTVMSDPLGQFPSRTRRSPTMKSAVQLSEVASSAWENRAMLLPQSRT